MSGSRLRSLLLCGVGWCLSACDASFEDLRPDRQANLALDAGGAAPTDVGVIAQTRRFTLAWMPLDYDMSGQSELSELSDGRVLLRMNDNFRAFPVPGPVLVASDRSTLAPALEPGDVRIGALRMNAGADVYEVPQEVLDRGFLFVFCEPFGLDVGRAALTPASGG